MLCVCVLGDVQTFAELRRCSESSAGVQVVVHQHSRHIRLCRHLVIPTLYRCTCHVQYVGTWRMMLLHTPAYMSLRNTVLAMLLQL